MLPLARSELLGSLESLLREAGREGERRLVSVTVPVEIEDPVAAVATARLATDRWFCWEQPDRGFALATLGMAHEAPSRGPGRFDDVAASCAEVGRNRLADEGPQLPAGAGPVFVGGFAFSPEGGRSPHWSSFPPALFVLPELALVRDREGCHLTLAALGGPGRDRPETLRRAAARIASLRPSAELPLLEPHVTGETTIRSSRPPRRHEAAVAEALDRIRDGTLEKVVLAREVVVESPGAHDPAALFGALRELFPACFCFCFGTAEGAFIGASPELLVRRFGASAATVALAGSTRRSADPAVDDHLGERLLRSDKDRHEHAIVARRIERLLRPHSVWVEAEDEPSLVRVANVQHLATPIHAQLSQPRSTIELAGMLHPTPAVAGEPRGEALMAIDDLEGLDRGWYAGPVGWMDTAEDGELCVALRSALLRDRSAHLYAGGGIVAGSEPAAELAETEIKLEALLPLLAS